MLVPVTQKMYDDEVGLDLRSHHILLLKRDMLRLETAVKSLKCKKRAQIRSDLTFPFLRSASLGALIVGLPATRRMARRSGRVMLSAGWWLLVVWAVVR